MTTKTLRSSRSGFILWLLFLLVIDTHGYLSEYEYNVLNELYITTHGSGWTWAGTGTGIVGSEWSFIAGNYSDPCGNDWQGVTCSDSAAVCGVPTTICHLTALALPNYNLTGPLPASLVQLNYSQTLDLTSNCLTGALPAFGAAAMPMPDLVSLAVSFNSLSSFIPSSLCEISTLKQLNMEQNDFSGTFPPCFASSLTQLQVLNVGYNNLEGPAPLSSFSGNNALIYYNIENNQLTGFVVDASITTLPYASTLQFLIANNNQLYGSLSSALNQLTALVTLDLSVNNLDGTIPSLQSLGLLTSLSLANNSLHGPLSNVFGSNQMLLSSIDISDNGLTGSLPSVIFTLGSLSIFAAGSNCMGQIIPSEICQAQLLQTLSLNGLNSNPRFCKGATVFFAKTPVANVVEGGLPACVWYSLPQLRSLHVAINSLTGTLDDSDQATTENLNPLMVNVTVSYNRLTGDVPAALQQTSFQIFDISHNKISGVVADLLATSANVTYTFNRLSGYLPMSFKTALNVNVLLDNLFNCNDAHPLPDHDPESKRYNCGSSQLDQAMIIMGCVTCFALGLLLIYRYHEKKQLEKHRPQSRRRQKGTKLSTAEHGSSSVGSGRNSSVDSASIDLDRDLDGDVDGDNPLLRGSVAHSSSSSSGDIEDCDIDVELNNSITATSATATSNGHNTSGGGNSPPFLLLHYYIHLLDWLNFRLVDMQKHGMHHLHHFVVLLHLYRRMSTVMFGFMICVVLPTYVGMKYNANNKVATHKYQYGWSSTMAFLSGVTPATVIMILWFCLTYYMLAKIQHISTASSKSSHEWARLEIDEQLMEQRAKKLREQRQRRASERAAAAAAMASANAEGQSTTTTSSSQKGRGAIDASHLSPADLVSFEDDFHDEKTCLARMRLLFTTLGLLSINVAIVLSVNIAYVTLTISNRSGLIKILAQLALAGFNQLWGNVVVPLCIQAISANIEVLETNPAARVRLHVLILLFNSVMAPCIAAASTNPACFQGMFVTANPLVTSYPGASYCSSYLYDPSSDSSACAVISAVTAYSELVPAYQYYYQCGSALIVAYVPVYIYAYVGMGFFLPLIYGFLAMYDLATLPIPGIQNCFSYHVLWPRDTQMPAYDLLRADDLISYFMYHFAMLMTFGLASPALAFVIWITICVTSYQWEILIARYLKYSPRSTMNQTIKPPAVIMPATTTMQDGSPTGSPEKTAVLSTSIVTGSNLAAGTAANAPGTSLVAGTDDTGTTNTDNDRSGGLEESCKLIWKGPMKAVWIIIWGSAIFFAAMLFDIAGDYIGWYAAMSVWVIMLALPIAMFLSSSRAMLVIQSKTPPSVKLFLNTLFVTLRCDEIYDWYKIRIVKGRVDDIRESFADGAQKIKSAFSCTECGKSYRRWRRWCCGGRTVVSRGSPNRQQQHGPQNNGQGQQNDIPSMSEVNNEL